MTEDSIATASREVAEIPVGDEHRALVDQEDLPLVAPYTWRLVQGERINYARTRIKGRPVLLHRFLLNAPKRANVDHVNGDGLDNRRENLRFATHSQNAANLTAPPRGKSGIRGVHFSKGRWNAYYAQKFLGSFDTAEEATRAHNAYVIARDGEYARPHRTPVQGRLDGISAAMGLSALEAEVLTLNVEGGLAYDVIAEHLGVTLEVLRGVVASIQRKVIAHQTAREEQKELERMMKQCSHRPRERY